MRKRAGIEGTVARVGYEPVRYEDHALSAEKVEISSISHRYIYERTSCLSWVEEKNMQRSFFSLCKLVAFVQHSFAA